MAPIATIVQGKTDTAIADKNTLFAKTSLLEPLAVNELYFDIIENL